MTNYTHIVTSPIHNQFGCPASVDVISRHRSAKAARRAATGRRMILPLIDGAFGGRDPKPQEMVGTYCEHGTYYAVRPH